MTVMMKIPKRQLNDNERLKKAIEKKKTNQDENEMPMWNVGKLLKAVKKAEKSIEE